MVVVYKDIFFTNIPGVDHGDCHLDVYLPDKVVRSGDRYYSDKEYNEKTDKVVGTDGKHNGLNYIEEVKSRNDNQDACTQRPFIRTDQRLCFSDEITTSTGNKLKNDTSCHGVPFVLFIHGGGWRRGGRAAWTHYLYFDVNFLVAFLQYFVGTYGNIGEALAENNIACAVLSYPLTEAGSLIVLVEMFLSYLQSCLFVVLSCVPVLGVLAFFIIISHGSHSNTWELIFKEQESASTVGTLCLISMLFTNLTTTFLFFVRTKQYNFSINQIRYFAAVTFVSSLIVFNSHSPLLFLVISTLVLNQGMIFYQRLRRHGASYEQQVQAVAQAVRWAKSFSQNTGYTDSTRLYLMGHSAGGHLATLSALDESILASVSCSTTDLKGIISISGVYDLLCLNKHLLRPVYLEPTFGRNSATWLAASPEHLAKRTKGSSTMPKFLLMLAEKDLFLKSQSFKFAQTLEDLKFDCQHVEICRTNHFNIVTNTGTSHGTTLSYVLAFVN